MTVSRSRRRCRIRRRWRLLRGRVYDEVAETYPDFAAQMRREIEQPLSHAS